MTHVYTNEDGEWELLNTSHVGMDALERSIRKLYLSDFSHGTGGIGFMLVEIPRPMRIVMFNKDEAMMAFKLRENT